MSLTIIETVQEALGYQPLIAVDPNIQDIPGKEDISPRQLFAQAAIPVALHLFYEMSQAKEGAAVILRGKLSPEWEKTFYQGHQQELAEIIAAYSGESPAFVKDKFSEMVGVIPGILLASLEKGSGEDTVRKLFADQHHVILAHLPGVLKIGQVLGDDTTDDRTHKMEGPVSSLMHNVGKGFSSPKDE